MIAPTHASSRFLRRMFFVFLRRTLPASSMPKPHCMKKTVTPAHISQNVSASDAERKIALPVPSSLAWMFATSEATPVTFCWTPTRVDSRKARRSSIVGAMVLVGGVEVA